jgi:hypothetical protein
MEIEGSLPCSQEPAIEHSTRLRVGRSKFDSLHGLNIFLLATVSKPALGPHPARYPMGSGRLFPWR